MFVSNTNEDIRIELSALEPGWKIKGSKVKVTEQMLENGILREESVQSYNKLEFKSKALCNTMRSKAFPFINVRMTSSSNVSNLHTCIYCNSQPGIFREQNQG